MDSKELVRLLGKALELRYLKREDVGEREPRGFYYIFDNEEDMNNAILFFEDPVNYEQLNSTHAHLSYDEESGTGRFLIGTRKGEMIWTDPVIMNKQVFIDADQDSSNHRILWFAYVSETGLILNFPKTHKQTHTYFIFS